MMKTSCIKLICGLALLGAVSQVSAEPFVYTMTSHLTGSLGGTDFTDAYVTLTTYADTTNILDGSEGGMGYWLIENTTIQIDGLNLATFNDVLVQDLSYPCGVVAWDLEPRFGSPALILGFVHPVDEGLGYPEFILAIVAPQTYDLSTAATFTGDGDLGEVNFSSSFLGEPVDSFSTDQGALVITGTSGVTTFTAAAVPEPASAMMLIFGAGIGLAVHRARRSALRR
jgi:hypothetical protein